MVTLTKTFSASLAHRYWHPAWSEAENAKIFLKDAYPEGLGANLDISFSASGLSLESELAPALAKLKSSVDHKCLFEPCHPLASGPSTLEKITEYLAEILKTVALSEGHWSALEVRESSSLSCIWSARSQSFALRVKCFNLVLTLSGPIDAASGLIISRGVAEQVVRRVFFATGDKAESDLNKWGSGLFTALCSELSLLTELRIDLPRQEYLIFSKNV